MQGRVIRVSGLQSLVEIEREHWQCELRGRLKAGIRKTNSPIVAGDWVEVAQTAERMGIIESVHPRESIFSRGASGNRPFEQILSVNMDQVVIVVAARQPAPRIGFVDRAIIMALRGNLQPIICINKIDLVAVEEAQKLAAPYQKLEYPVYMTSASCGEGIVGFKDVLRDKVSTIVGQSGVGKSTLLNCIEPGLGLKTREIMARHDRGRHTTSSVHLFKLQQGGYVADTPGIKELRLWGVGPLDLPHYFSEIEPLIDQCQFGDCRHINEPNCAVRAAVDAGQIAPTRYDGYCRILESLEVA